MDSKSFHSAVTDQLRKQVLFRGTIRAVLGATILVWVGLSTHLVAQYGLLAFALGLGLISWGLIPYNRLKKYMLAPAKLTITETQLIYERAPSFRREIELAHITRLEYVENSALYGLEVDVNNTEKFFFPYFTRRTVIEIKDQLTTDQPE